VKIAWLPTARETLAKAIDYVAKDSPKAALEQLALIETRVDSLADHPEQGRVGRRRGTRELVIARTPFIVVYRLRQKPEQIEVLRVLHGAQKWP